ncbi:NAD(P)H-binding protein [Membranihabitans marinus]|uniref:NAD(P)H-binding protein n=1 Tax=Membranihabitans marinus TaxID=1227546 RepID=UPI001F452B6B|nr:NAD(P)H-binding protein [Membranihabitans marinus]
MKVAVTAANGQLGSTIVNQLINEIGRENVIGIARTPTKASHLAIQLRQGDYNNRQEFDKALIGVDVLLLISGMDDPQKRIQQHRNIIEAAKQNKVRKIVYTSIIGEENRTAFSPIVRSNRQTEKDIQDSGLQWAIGRNGIYIEPDLEYIDEYKRMGEIVNCAENGKCGYTSRSELAIAYTQLLLNDNLNGQIYNLAGKPISQSELADFLNQAYLTNLSYRSVSVADYEKDRKEALGDFIGGVIAGIYEGIQIGAYDKNSDFEKIVNRPHKSVIAMMADYIK